MAAAATPAGGWAQEAAANPTQTVEVRSDAQQAQRADIAGKRVVSREELLRHGDTQLVDALRRVPGITVLGAAGRAELTLNGLGGGYTQILLNGEPLPKGFAVEQLSPELIERVEILRGGSAEWSAQGVAGSINIVTRRAPRWAQRELKLGTGSYEGRARASADLSLGDKDGDLSWGLNLGLAHEPLRWPVRMVVQSRDAQGQLTQSYVTDKQEGGRDQSLTLAPRLAWTLGEGHQLSTDHLLRVFQTPGGATDQRFAELGPPPQLSRNQLVLEPRSVMLRSRLSWQLKQADGRVWDSSLVYTGVRRNQVADFVGDNAAGLRVRQTHVDSLAVDQSLNASAKGRLPLGEAHTLAMGGSLEWAKRQEDRIQREQALPGGWLPENLDEVYDAQVQRLALFAQDDWVLSPALTASLGLRWEGLRTVSQSQQRNLGLGDSVDAEVRQSHSVWSPVLRAMWSLPDSKDQLKLALSRSYRLPNARELTPRRYVANENSVVTPTNQGNPALQPELAWSLDGGWEHPLGPGAQFTLNVGLKRIDQVVLDELLAEPSTQLPGTTTWVLRRANFDRAEVFSLGVEANGPLQRWWPQGPALELRGGLTLNRSRLLDVALAGGRLPAQPPWALNLGVDYRPKASALTAGVNVQAQGSSSATQPNGRVLGFGAQRSVDVFAAWRQSDQSMWRLALSQWLARDELERIRVTQATGTVSLDQVTQTRPSLRLSWERKI
jgi:outer membrane receptor protein involved in Fe transport